MPFKKPCRQGRGLLVAREVAATVRPIAVAEEACKSGYVLNNSVDLLSALLLAQAEHFRLIARLGLIGGTAGKSDSSQGNDCNAAQLHLCRLTGLGMPGVANPSPASCRERRESLYRPPR